MSRFDLSHYPLWTALVTPFNTSGTVDYNALADLLDQQAAAGNGILLLGSTGEGLALTNDEQQQVVNFACQHSPDAPLMVAIGGYNLDHQLQWIEFCNNLPIDSYLLAAPLYAKPGPKGQELWFNALLERSQHPCMIYNVPSRSGVDLSLDALANLAEHPNFWSVKEASGCSTTFNDFKKALPSIAIFSGEDAMLAEFSALGAAGLVSVCANAWPQATRLYVEQCLAASMVEDLPLWQASIAPLFSVANPIPVKILMHQQQLIKHPDLRMPLTHQELTQHGALIEANTQIEQWFSQQ